MKRKAIFWWLSSTLIGNICLFELLGMVPGFLVLYSLVYDEGAATLWWVISSALVFSVCGVFGGLLLWLTLTRPLLDKRNSKLTKGGEREGGN